MSDIDSLGADADPEVSLEESSGNELARAGWVLFGGLLAAAFLIIHVAVFLLQLLSAPDVPELLIVQLIASVLLSPLIALPIRKIRKTASVPRSRDAVWIILFVASVLAVVLKALNVGADPGVALLVFTPVVVFLPAIATLDLVRVRTLRTSLLVVVLIVALWVDVPAVGVSIARECLDEHRDAVLAGTADTGPGQCGLVSWSSTWHNTSTDSIWFHGAGGSLNQQGLVWGEGIDGCPAETERGCRNARDLGDGWVMYSSPPPTGEIF